MIGSILLVLLLLVVFLRGHVLGSCFVRLGARINMIMMIIIIISAQIDGVYCLLQRLLLLLLLKLLLLLEIHH